MTTIQFRTIVRDKDVGLLRPPVRMLSQVLPNLQTITTMPYSLGRGGTTGSAVKRHKDLLLTWMGFSNRSAVKITWQNLMYFESVGEFYMELYPPISYEGARIQRVNTLQPELP
jgi:hypothetical protein